MSTTPRRTTASHRPSLSASIRPAPHLGAGIRLVLLTGLAALAFLAPASLAAPSPETLDLLSLL